MTCTLNTSCLYLIQCGSLGFFKSSCLCLKINFLFYYSEKNFFKCLGGVGFGFFCLFCSFAFCLGFFGWFFVLFVCGVFFLIFNFITCCTGFVISTLLYWYLQPPFLWCLLIFSKNHCLCICALVNSCRNWDQQHWIVKYCTEIHCRYFLVL